MRVIQERDGSNNPLVSYTRGNDLSGTMEGSPRESPSSTTPHSLMPRTLPSTATATSCPSLSRGKGGIGGLLARSSGYSGGNFTTHNYYFADGNGNVTYMLNSSQAMVASYRYDPFGNTISSSGTLASANVYRFSSKEIHANSGMYYYGYRFYDPNLQRWINRDPIGERGGINLYAFLHNDSLGSYDPYGLDACTDACNRQNTIDIALCVAIPVVLTAGGCYLFPPICAAIARAGAKAMFTCLAAAEVRYLACLAGCARNGKCPPYPIGPPPPGRID